MEEKKEKKREYKIKDKNVVKLNKFYKKVIKKWQTQ